MGHPGRPSKWTPELEDEFCELIATGESILDLCKLPQFPDKMNVYRRMAKDAEFATKIARARELQQEHETDYMIALADSATPEDHQVKKLQIWARQWRAAKLAPKKYGDRISTELSGPDGGPVKTDMILSLPPDTVAAVTGYAERLRAKIKPPGTE